MLAARFHTNAQAQAPPANTASSSSNRTTPGTGTGALPERLGSSCTLSVPHTAIVAIGTPKLSRYRSQPSAACQPHRPSPITPATSSRKRSAKFHALTVGVNSSSRVKIFARSTQPVSVHNMTPAQISECRSPLPNPFYFQFLRRQQCVESLWKPIQSGFGLDRNQDTR